MYYLPNDQTIDFRNINLKLSKDQDYLKALFEDWKQESRDARTKSGIEDIWRKSIEYYEGHQLPLGFSDNYLLQFVAKNDSGLDFSKSKFIKKDDKNQMYMIDNRIMDVIDGTLGEYTSVTKSTQVISDTITRNNGIERAIKELFGKYEKKKNIWTKVRMPAIRNQSKLGLGWTKLLDNPKRNLPIGDIDFYSVHPSAVYFDPDDNTDFLDSNKYRIHSKRFSYQEATEFLVEKYGVNPHDIIPDSDSDNQDDYRIDNPAITRRVTIDFIEFKKTYTEKYINKSQVESLGIDVDLGELEEEIDYYFYAVYNTHLGVLDFKINPNTFNTQVDFDKYTLTPYMNKRSELRQYPISDIEKLCNIQDLINITETLVLDNMRQRNLVRLLVRESLYEKYGEAMDKWLRYGGVFPIDDEDGDMSKVFKEVDIQELPPVTKDFLTIVLESFQNQTDRREPLQGDYPNQLLSGKAIQLIQGQGRRKLSYKDIAINYAGTQESMKMYTLFATQFTEEDYVNVLGAKKGDPKVVLFNAKRTLPEYEQVLDDAGLMDDTSKVMLKMLQPNDPMYFQKKMAVLKPISEKFESINEVIFVTPKTMQENPLVNYSSTLVFINNLSIEDKVTVSITLDFDIDKDKNEEKAIAMQLYGNGSGDYDFKFLLDDLGGKFADNKEEILAQRDKNKQLLQVQKMLEESGIGFDELMLMIQNYQKVKEIQEGQQVGEQQPGKAKPKEKEVAQ